MKKGWPHASLLAAFCGGLCLAFAAGCGPASGVQAKFAVDQPTALNDQPVAITISQLRVGQRLTLTARTLDADGGEWKSSADFAADAHGVVNLATAQPTNGAANYRSPAAMGLFWSMVPVKARAQFYVPPTSGSVITLAARSGGEDIGSFQLIRLTAANGVKNATEAIATSGFVGRFWSPPSGKTPHPAVLIIGGSEGGISTGGSLFASHGYSALEIAYFKAPGLPATLAEIPLEYFATALKWLASQANVDASKVIVYGYSRGSEAAQLLGVNYPDLVHGVVALVPSNVALCSYPRCSRGAWALAGQPLPFTDEFDEPAPANRAAVIAVEKIRGPIFLACGAADLVWDSCAYASAIQQRLEAYHFAYGHTLKSYAQAGHGIGFPFPFQPDLSAGTRFGGNSPSANPIADADLWPRVLGFLGTQ